MDTVKTTAGKTYSITASAACTVSCTLGGAAVPLAELSAPGSTTFVAPGGEVTIDTQGSYRIFPIKAPRGLAVGGASAGDPFANVQGDYLLLGTNRDKVEGRLDTLSSGMSMFFGCTSLTNWKIPLPALKQGSAMFYWCTRLTHWGIQMPSLEQGDSMFYGCTSLTSFGGILPVLRVANSMFQVCTSLTSFQCALPALENGENMFRGCKLDLASVQLIASSLPFGQLGYITLGIDSSLKGNAELEAALATIRAKRWEIDAYYN